MYVSPSFADEFFGMLAAKLGLDEYANRVHLINIPDSAHDLIAHVVYRRGTQQQSTATGLQIPVPTRDAVMNLFKKSNEMDAGDLVLSGILWVRED